MNYFVHPQALCESTSIGDRTRVWAFAHVLPGAKIGEDCNICDHVFIENDVVIGNSVTIKCGVQLWDSLRVEDDVFIGPNATFSNDPFPRSKVHLESYPVTTIARGASIGANCTILPGIRIGMNAMIGAGSIVTHDVPPHAIVMGDPARITGYADADVRKAQVHTTQQSALANESTDKVSLVGGAYLKRFMNTEDMRGTLSAADFDSDIPFVVKRLFMVYGVPSHHVRGEHAHRSCDQFLIVTCGSVRVMLDDGKKRDEVVLDDPSMGLYLPRMVWASRYQYSKDAVLLVLASETYDPSDYIRDYETFIEALAAGDTKDA